MKILITNTGPWGTGSFTVTKAVSDELQLMGHQVKIFFPDDGTPCVDLDKYYSQSETYEIWKFPIQKNGVHLSSFPLIIPVVNTLLNLSYPNKRVIVSVNGSKDKTLDLLKENYELFPLPTVIPQTLPVKEVKAYYKSKKHPNLTIIEKELNEKSDGQNAAINLTESPFIVTVDADTYIDDRAFNQSMEYFLCNPGINTLGSLVGVAHKNQPESNAMKLGGISPSLFSRMQQLDYDMIIIGYRCGGIYTGDNLVIPGAFGIIQRDDIIDLNGFCEDTLVNDVDLTMGIHKHYLETNRLSNIQTVPFYVNYTSVPKNFPQLVSQRERWERGALEIFRKYKSMFFWFKYGSVGNFGLVYYAIQVFIFPIVQLYTILIFPLGLLVDYYNWYKVASILISLLIMKAVEGCHLLLIKDVLLEDRINLNNFYRNLSAALFYFILLASILLCWIIGIFKFFGGSKSWALSTLKCNK